MITRFAGVLLAGAIVILSGCANSDDWKNLVQLKELSPEAGRTLASLPFDAAAPITVRGTASTLLFGETSGALVVKASPRNRKYVFSTAATPVLARQGLNRFTIKPGEVVTVTGVLAEGGRQVENLIAARASTIDTADGRRIFDRSAR